MITPGGNNVQSLIFGEGGVEISYLHTQESDGGTGIQEIRTVAVPGHIVADSLAEVLDSIDDLIRDLHVARRQPPPTKQR